MQMNTTWLYLRAVNNGMDEIKRRSFRADALFHIDLPADISFLCAIFSVAVYYLDEEW